MMLEKRGLWQHRDFLNLWAAQIVSAFGSRITRTAIPALAVLSLGASDGETALLGALSMAPAVLTGLLAARFIDRLSKRPLLIAADLVRAILVVSIPIAAWMGALSLWQLYVVAILAGAATAMFQIADQSYLPAVVGRANLLEGNTKLTASESVAEIGGPGLAGLLIHLLTAPVAMLVDALSFLWSAIFLTRVKAAENLAEHIEDQTKGAGEGLRAIWRNPYIRPFFLSEMIGMTGWGFFASLYMLFVLRDLHVPIQIAGLVIGVGGLGALFGAVVAAPLSRAIGAGRATLLFIVLNMGAAILMPLALLAPSMAIALLIGHQLVGDGFGAAYSIQSTSIRQIATPPGTLGRVNASFVTMHAASLLTGSLLATGLATAFGTLQAVIVGVGLQLIGILPILSPTLLRLRRAEDAGV